MAYSARQRRRALRFAVLGNVLPIAVATATNTAPVATAPPTISEMACFLLITWFSFQIPNERRI